VLSERNYGPEGLTLLLAGCSRPSPAVLVAFRASDGGQTVADSPSDRAGRSRTGRKLAIWAIWPPRAPVLLDRSNPPAARGARTNDVDAAGQSRMLRWPGEACPWSHPTWFLVADGDQVIPPDAERQFAARMGATTVEIPTNHVAMVSHPDDVVRLIHTATGALQAA
jgi:pimeloyl-ACP methyl ester carboxylesterase